jgi:hypothetical protein
MKPMSMKDTEKSLKAIAIVRFYLETIKNKTNYIKSQVKTDFKNLSIVMSFEACKKSCLSKFLKIISMMFLPQFTFIKILIRFEKVIDDTY